MARSERFELPTLRFEVWWFATRENTIPVGARTWA